MEQDELTKLVEQLKAAGLLAGILDDNGEVEPSDAAFEMVEAQYPNEPPTEIWRLAKAQTIIDLTKHK